MPWLIFGAGLIIAAVFVWWRERAYQAHRRATQASVWCYSFAGVTEWRWLCPMDNAGTDGHPNRSAAILAAERAGYWVEGDDEKD